MEFSTVHYPQTDGKSERELSSIGEAPYETLYSKECISPIHWNEMGEMLILDPEVVQGIIEIIRRLELGCSLLRVNGKVMLI